MDPQLTPTDIAAIGALPFVTHFTFSELTGLPLPEARRRLRVASARGDDASPLVSYALRYDDSQSRHAAYILNVPTIEAHLTGRANEAAFERCFPLGVRRDATRDIVQVGPVEWLRTSFLGLLVAYVRRHHPGLLTHATWYNDPARIRLGLEKVVWQSDACFFLGGCEGRTPLRVHAYFADDARAVTRVRRALHAVVRAYTHGGAMIPPPIHFLLWGSTPDVERIVRDRIYALDREVGAHLWTTNGFLLPLSPERRGAVARPGATAERLGEAVWWRGSSRDSIRSSWEALDAGGPTQTVWVQQLGSVDEDASGAPES